jgi:hypothetical protein
MATAMKKLFLSIGALIALAGVFTSLPAFAQDSSETMTDDHIARIKSNCQAALGTLGRIHANDAPVYINRNQTYFSIGDKLMARLNGRLALNRFDSSDLVKTASDYNVALTRFRTAYKQYDDTMSDVLHIDCTREPVSFYDKVNDARELRGEVNGAVQQLKALIDQYQQDVQTFKYMHADQLNGGRS